MWFEVVWYVGLIAMGAYCMATRRLPVEVGDKQVGLLTGRAAFLVGAGAVAIGVVRLWLLSGAE